MNKAIIGIMMMALLVACTANENLEPIKIGWIGPLSGDVASIGEAARSGAQLAVEEINAEGGINGRPLEIIYEDSQCNGAVATKAANKLLNIDNVPVIIGGLCSAETLAIAPQAEDMGRVVVSYCSSAPSISEAGDYIFRTYPSDTYEGEFAAEYLYNEGVRKVATLACLADACQQITKVFNTKFTALGGEIVGSSSYEQESRDLRTELTKLRSRNPEVLYFVGYTEATIVGIKQVRELGWDVKLFGWNAWIDETIPRESGEAGESARFAVMDVQAPLGFKQKVKQNTGADEVTICLPQAYDAVKIIANAMREGASTPAQIKDALYSMKPYEGASGRIEFDENGDMKEAPMTVKQYRNGAVVAYN